MWGHGVLVVLLLCLDLAVACQWALLHVAPDGCSIRQLKPHHTCHPTPPLGRGHTHQVFGSGASASLPLASGTPLLSWTEHLSQGALQGGAHPAGGGYLAVTVPHDIEHLVVVAGGQAMAEVPLNNRSVHVLQADDTVATMRVVQQVGSTATQLNLAILSSGYTAVEEPLFWRDVERVVSVLSLPEGAHPGVSSDPWPRYFPLVNVFAVYEASVDSGASIPHGPGHVPPSTPYCDKEGRCEPFTVQNNLGCSYGTPQRKMLSCDFEKVFALGSYTPNPTLHLVVVNHGAYGGTGTISSGTAGSGVVVVYNGKEMGYLVVHELGHAFAHLADEYDYGVTDHSELNLINCSPRKTNVSWQPWIERGAVDVIPTKPCSYSNYYRPTRGKCLMGAAVPQMCAVCKEAVTLAFYDHITDLATPRCPSEWETVYLAGNETVTLRVNDAFASQSDIQVSWKVPGNGVYTPAELSRTRLLVKASDLGLGSHRITVEIRDDTPLVLPERRVEAMTHSSHFWVSVVETNMRDVGESCQMRRCEGIGWADPPYCSRCASGRSCNLTYSVTPRQAEEPKDVELSTAKQWIWIVGGAIFGGTVVVFLAFLHCVARYRKKHICEVVVLPPPMKRIRKAAMGLCVFTGVVCGIAATIGVYSLDQEVVYGGTLLLAGVVFAALNVLLAFVMFGSVYMLVASTLAITSFLYLLLSLATLGLGAAVLWVGRNMTSSTLKTALKDEWMDLVRESPAKACTIQRHFECSGFLHPCHNLPSLPPFCPSHCEVGNRASNPCFAVLREHVEDNFIPLGATLIGVTLLLITCCICCCLLASAISQRRAEMRRRRRCRLKGLGKVEETPSDDEEDPPLNNEEISLLEVEFTKADTDGSGHISEGELLQFWRDALREDPTPLDLSRARTFLDSNGDGRVSFQEFLALYQPFDHRFAASAPQKDRSGAPADPQMLGELTPSDVKYLTSRFKELSKGTYCLLSRQSMREWYTDLYGRVPMSDELEDFSKVMDPERTGQVDLEGFSEPYRRWKKERAQRLIHDLGIDELRCLRKQFADINVSGDSVLTGVELEGFYRLYKGCELPRDPLARRTAMATFTQQVSAASVGGRIGFLEFCLPFARRVRRRNRMREGLTSLEIQALRSQYLELDRTPEGDLTTDGVRQLFRAVYRTEPSEAMLRGFMDELDLEKNSSIGFDEILRLFAESSRVAKAKRWLLEHGVAEYIIEGILREYRDISEYDDGLCLGPTKDAYSRLYFEKTGVKPDLKMIEGQAKWDESGHLSEMEFAMAAFYSFLQPFLPPPPAPAPSNPGSSPQTKLPPSPPPPPPASKLAAAPSEKRVEAVLSTPPVQEIPPGPECENGVEDTAEFESNLPRVLGSLANRDTGPTSTTTNPLMPQKG